MQFAQNHVSLQHGSSRSVRGSIQGADICDYEDAFGASWEGSFVQLSPGRLNAAIEFFSGDDFALCRETWQQRMHLVGTIMPGSISIGIPSSARQQTRWWGQTLSSTYIPIARSTGELNLITEANEGFTALTIGEQEFLAIFARLTGLQPSDFPGRGHYLKVNTAAARQVLHFWDTVLAQVSKSDICEWSVVDLIAPLIAALEFPAPAHYIEMPKTALLHTIMDVAEASNFQMSVPQLSFALNVSRRTIEYAFQNLIGESPKAYFTARRLSLCKHELTAADPGDITVAAIATRHGFYELGRFASVYRHYFGELPSSTLRRRKASLLIKVEPVVDHFAAAVSMPTLSA